MTKKIIILVMAFGVMFSCDNAESDFYIIKSGTSFGHCSGYCITELTIDSNNILFSEKGWNLAESPEKITELSISRDQYANLCETVNLNEFISLDEKIGCPDCYDQGSEWIEIRTNNFSKKITFSFGEEIKEINDLLVKIREIRNQFTE